MTDNRNTGNNHLGLNLLVMYQPVTEYQILPYEQAMCLALRTWYKLNGHELSVCERYNAESMSPDGNVPFLCNNQRFVFSQWDQMINAIAFQTKATVKPSPYSALFTEALYGVMVHICWCIPEVYENYTSRRYSAHLPWPLNKIVCFFKKMKIQSFYANQNVKDVYDHFNVINIELDNKDFLGNNKPSEIDALLYGFVEAIKNLEGTILYQYFSELDNYTNVIAHYEKMKERVPLSSPLKSLNSNNESFSSENVPKEDSEIE